MTIKTYTNIVISPRNLFLIIVLHNTYSLKHFKFLTASRNMNSLPISVSLVRIIILFTFNFRTIALLYLELRELR
jgi:hypothetical protein